MALIRKAGEIRYFRKRMGGSGQQLYGFVYPSFLI